MAPGAVCLRVGRSRADVRRRRRPPRPRPVRQFPHRSAHPARSPGRVMAPAAPATARTTVPGRLGQCHLACPTFPIHPSRALPVGAAPPHPLSHDCPAQSPRSALGFPHPPDTVVRLLPTYIHLSAPLGAIMGKLLQNAAALDQRRRDRFWRSRTTRPGPGAGAPASFRARSTTTSGFVHPAQPLISTARLSRASMKRHPPDRPSAGRGPQSIAGCVAIRHHSLTPSLDSPPASIFGVSC